MKQNQNYLYLLIKIRRKTNISHREFANELDFNLGVLNYLINTLKLKELIEIKNYKNNQNKIKFFNILTFKEVAIKAKIILNFMKRKCMSMMNLNQK